MAHCHDIHRHGDRCFLTRTKDASPNAHRRGKFAGQGRPLGLLMAWILDGHRPHLLDQKMHLKHKVSLQARQAARNYLKGLDGAAHLLEMERERRDDEEEEPLAIEYKLEAPFQQK